MPVIKQERLKGIREYIIQPHNLPDDFDHPQAIVLRIGQYPQEADKPIILKLPPAYFVELEMRDVEKRYEVGQALKYEIPHKHIDEMKQAVNGDTGNESYTTEYKIKRSRFALEDLDAFILDLVEKLTTSHLINANDANDIIANEKKHRPPTATEIIRG